MLARKLLPKGTFSKTLGCILFLSILKVEPAFSLPKGITPAEIQPWKEWTYSLALQAATWGAPLVTMYALRYSDSLSPNAKGSPNTIWHMENIVTPELSKQAHYVTPNVNVIYGFGFMDLHQEPIIVEVPDSHNRYYMVQVVDMWTNAFAYLGGKASDFKKGKYALVGPGWEGDLPPEVKRVDCPTPWVLLQPRVHIYVDGKLDLEGAKTILNAITTTGIAKYTGKPSPETPQYNYPAPHPSNPDLSVSTLSFKDPLEFWELLVEAMNENPPPDDQISALLPMFKPLGIELGKPWDRTKVPKLVALVMEHTAEKIGNVLSHLPLDTTYQGASFPPMTIGNPKTDYRTRAVVARIGLTANIPEEAVYWIYLHDKDKDLLTGKKKYIMNFKEGIPYYEPGFWSITMYDAKTNYTINNPINRYMLGSDTPELKKNKDGSFTIYIQKDSPGKDKESNWLPCPSGPFYLIPRSYLPKPEAIDLLKDPKSWPVPAVVPVD